MRYAYPFALTPDEDGRLVVAFPDVQGASTDGADEREAVANAQDCLIAALIAHVAQHQPLPSPSPARGRPTVTLAPLVTAKLALYETMLERGIGTAELARRMAVSEADVQRLLDLDHRSDISQIGAALTKLGKRLEIRVSNAA